MLVVSIVLYQHEQRLLELVLQGLLASKVTRQIVLVDNGGCDWAARLDQPRISYIKAPSNKGYGAGHNLALHSVTTSPEYFLVCNPDIIVPTGGLDQLVELVKSLEGGLFMPNIVYPDGSRQELCKLLPSPLNLFARRFWPALAEKLDDRYMLRDADYTQRFFAPSLSGCFMLMRFAALKAENGFDERYFMYMEDVDLSRRLASRFGSWFIPQVTVIHEFQKASYKNPVLLKAHVKSAIRYFCKWGWMVDTERGTLNRRCLAELPRHDQI